MRALLLPLVLGFVAVAPSRAQPAVVPPATAGPPPAPAAPRRPLLWRVEDADSRVYLLGSVHALRPGTDVLPGAAAAAYADADVLAFEIDFDLARADAAAATAVGVATDGIALSKRLGPADARRLERRLETAGLSLAPFESFEPWLVAVVLLTLPDGSARLSAAAGVDAVLYARAAADGRERLGLETIADQTGAFDGLPIKDQLALLRDALGSDGLNSLDADSVDAGGQMPLVAAWEAGDAEALAAIVASGLGASTVMRRRLLTDRNARWLPQIEALLARTDEDVLVVVGAGHLVGPGSVVEMLRARGLVVERVE
ncbi:MAG TPA: TraB/GumN family protein [Rubricoccaceae bacterium]